MLSIKRVSVAVLAAILLAALSACQGGSVYPSPNSKTRTTTQSSASTLTPAVR